jgi:hypothetical protein
MVAGFTDDSVPTNGYRVIYDLMQVVDRDKTVVSMTPRSRGYCRHSGSPSYLAAWAAWQPWVVHGRCHRRQSADRIIWWCTYWAMRRSG